MKVSLSGATGSPAVLADGLLTFENARPHVDRLVTSDSHSLEELLILKSEEAGTEFSWSLDGEGLNAAADGKGGLIFRSSAPQPIFAIPQPYAVDANGKRWAGALVWDGIAKKITVSLHLDHDAAYPMVLDPSIETMVWEQVSSPPTASNPVMAYDEARGRLVMYAAGVTWTTRGDVWSKASDSGPPSRFQTAMVYDRLRQKIVLFGGFDGSPNGDTWEWDGTGWTKILAVNSPQARAGHGMAYDSTRDRVVIFGGLGAEAVLQDMWEWTGSTWNELAPTTRPSARSGVAMTLDSNRGVVVLFGGTDPNAATTVAYDDTWEWNGTDWAQKVTDVHPSGLFSAASTFDTRNKRFTLLGGVAADGNPTDSLWYWEGTTWTQATPAGVAPPAGHSAGAGFIPGLNTLFMFGGFGALDTTWLWNSAGSEWTTLPKYSNQGAVALNAFFYDSARQKVISYAGSTTSTSSNDRNTTSTWNGTSWSAPAVGPGFLTNVGVAFDAARSQGVLFGGYGTGVSGANTLNYQLLADNQTAIGATYLWDGTNWALKTLTAAPQPRGDVAMIYDSIRQRVLLFGGFQPQTSNGCGVAPAKFYDDLWAWNGSTWTQLATTGPKPAARMGMGFSYDAVRDRAVLFGGEGLGLTYNDTWEFDGTNWILMAPVHVPSVNPSPALAYDTLRRRVTLFGTAKGATGGLLRTWTWDGTDWTNISSGTAPPARNNIRAVFDEKHGEFVLHGGANLDPAAAALNDTWRFYSRGGDCTQNSDCPTGYCTDGVCCERDECGTCEACNVIGSSGTCGKIRGAIDADSCTGGKSCDATGACKPVNGQACKVGSDCASGSCVDEVCCDTECKGTCQACRADLKASGSSGTCGPAKNGIDPKNDCPDDGALSCQRDGQCDGAGRCRTYTKGTSCGASACIGNRAAGRVCDGIGACTNSADGVDCAPFACANASGSCITACDPVEGHDCLDGFRCDEATRTCVTREGASCDGDHTVTAPDGSKQDCGTYKCDGSACKTACSSINDCVSPAVCSAGGKCVLDGSSTTPDEPGGCSCSTPRRSRTVAWPTLLLAAGLIIARARRRSRAF